MRASIRVCPMRLVVFLIAVLAAATAQAAQMRFPAEGKHAFLFDLPAGWQSKPDAMGLLLIPPAAQQHAMVYIGIIANDSLRGGSLEAVAAYVAKPAGVADFDTKEPARITDQKGATHRGTAFYGKIVERRGFARRAKIVIIPLAPGIWAQAW